MAQILKTLRGYTMGRIEPNSIQYTPIVCKRWTAENLAIEEIHIAYMYKHYNGRFILDFYPGITGHENYYLDDIKSRLDKLESKFVPTKGLFGMTKWENQNWFLCATSHRRYCTTDSYDTLTISMGGLREAIKTLEQRTKEET